MTVSQGKAGFPGSFLHLIGKWGNTGVQHDCPKTGRSFRAMGQGPFPPEVLLCTLSSLSR
jgi:hypothetical protein